MALGRLVKEQRRAAEHYFHGHEQALVFLRVRLGGAGGVPVPRCVPHGRVGGPLETAGHHRFHLYAGRAVARPEGVAFETEQLHAPGHHAAPHGLPQARRPFLRPRAAASLHPTGRHPTHRDGRRVARRRPPAGDRCVSRCPPVGVAAGAVSSAGLAVRLLDVHLLPHSVSRRERWEGHVWRFIAQ